MPMKQRGQKVYRTAKGKSIDMDMLRKKNELTPAVGNARVNARGDELGPGGQIIRKHEDVVADYYKDNTQPLVDEEPVAQTASAVAEEEPAKMSKTVSSRKTTRAQEATASEEEWVEDEDGNFTPKGE
jgi:hypothetical protein